MKSGLLRIALATAIAASTGVASATPPVIYGKYGTRSITVGFHNSIPTDCISSTIVAANAWNMVYADFDFKLNTASFQPRFEEQTPTFDDQNVTVQDGTPQNPNAIMTTRVRVNTSTKLIENTDITVDKRRINQTGSSPVAKLSCTGLNPTPADQLDFESSILHELGHVTGLEDVGDDASCALYYSLPLGIQRRALCADEKQAHIANYGKRFQILSLANVAGPQGVDIPARVFYDGTPKFPVQRKTKIVECASGWSCSDYNGTYSSAAPSPLTFNFKCTPSSPMATATFRWRTTLTDANGVITNAVDHTSTCTKPATAKAGSAHELGGVNRIVITP
ncbi:hypothetical protein J5226_19530 [Lysobacter sp. K5869]|uniref:hypothetical protein n=1 Tax=Lysobacter sp. K5869 TaxID=2820808 RepID=UPI001C061ABF|nr:hypothetical protein [Lysobacter sp. K5869]QWP75779.1 hypothetical protein J5226_19530 [Lysobacter sp. K5869]